MDTGRKADIDMLLKIIDNPYVSSGRRKAAEEALKTIAKESGLVRSMRERLIHENRQGRTDNVRDISDWVLKHSRYRND